MIGSKIMSMESVGSNYFVILQGGGVSISREVSVILSSGATLSSFNDIAKVKVLLYTAHILEIKH